MSNSNTSPKTAHYHISNYQSSILYSHNDMSIAKRVRRAGGAVDPGTPHLIYADLRWNPCQSHENILQIAFPGQGKQSRLNKVYFL